VRSYENGLWVECLSQLGNRMTNSVQHVSVTFILQAGICAFAVLVVYAFGIYLFSANIPVFVAIIGMDYQQAGTVTAVGMLSFLLGALATERISIWLGDRALVSVTLAVTSVCYFALSQVQTVGMLLMLRAALGFASATIWVPMVRVGTAAVPQGLIGLFLGAVNGGTTVGIMLNGTLLSWVQPSIGADSVWILASGTTIAALLAFRVVFSSSPAGTIPDATKVASVVPLQDRRIIFVLLIAGLSGLVGVPGATFISAYAETDLGRSTVSTGLMWSAVGGAGALGSLLLGQFADRTHIRLALVVAFIFLAGSYSAIALKAPSVMPLGLEISAAVMSVGYFGLYGLIPVMVAKTVGPQELVRVFGIATAIQAICGAVGNYVTGAAANTMSAFTPVFGGLATLAVLAIFISARLHSVGRSEP